MSPLFTIQQFGLQDDEGLKKPKKEAEEASPRPGTPAAQMPLAVNRPEDVGTRMLAFLANYFPTGEATGPSKGVQCLQVILAHCKWSIHFLSTLNSRCCKLVQDVTARLMLHGTQRRHSSCQETFAVFQGKRVQYCGNTSGNSSGSLL
jgi:hypothetical protein